MIAALLALVAFAGPETERAGGVVPSGSISLGEMADLAEQRIVGREVGAGTGAPTALTPLTANRVLVETPQAVTDSGGSVAWDVSLGRFAAYASLDGDHAFANPTNLQTGGIYGIGIAQDATGQRNPTWGATFERAPQIRRAASSVTTLLWFYDGVKLRLIGGEPRSKTIFSMWAGNVGDANQPAAEQEHLATSFKRFNGTTTGQSEYRVVCPVTVAGFAGAVAAVQYSTDLATWVYLDGTASGSGPGTGSACLLTSTGVIAGSWTALAAGAIAPTLAFRVVTYGGNGVADPQYNLSLETR